MAKRTDRDAPFRTVSDVGGRAGWLRGKRYGQIGYAEPAPEVAEVYKPSARSAMRTVAWRADDHGPLPVGKSSLQEQAMQYQSEKRGVMGRAGSKNYKGKAAPAPHADPRRQSSMQAARNHNSSRIALALTERRAPIATAGPSAPGSIALPVPVPSERVRPENVTYASREGQQEFRRAIIAAYGQCAVTGCKVEEALEAAHIIPYVDARSNVVSNGLCLRADIHRLYDRNLIQICGDGIVEISETLMRCYQDISGARIMQPADEGSRPNPVLLAGRHKFIATK